MEIRDFTMTAGDDKAIKVYVTDDNGAAVDITDATIAWKATQSLRSVAAISKSTSAGIAITSGPGGIFTITLVPANTATLMPGDYYHEAQVTFASSGLIATVLKGIMTIEPGFV